MILHWVYLSFAIILEVAANVLMKLSNGFSRKGYGITAILFVLAAFTVLSYAIEVIPLSIAYGIWGGIGLIATAIIGMFAFGERLKMGGWCGIIFIIIGVVLMRLTI